MSDVTLTEALDALEAPLDEIEHAFDEIRGDWSDPRDHVRDGWEAVAKLRDLIAKLPAAERPPQPAGGDGVPYCRHPPEPAVPLEELEALMGQWGYMTDADLRGLIAKHTPPKESS